MKKVQIKRLNDILNNNSIKKIKTNEASNDVLLKYLGKDQIVEESMSLADIYNIDVDLIKSTNKGSKIGF